MWYTYGIVVSVLVFILVSSTDTWRNKIIDALNLEEDVYYGLGTLSILFWPAICAWIVTAVVLGIMYAFLRYSVRKVRDLIN